jgi:hypothetical protein
MPKAHRKIKRKPKVHRKHTHTPVTQAIVTVQPPPEKPWLLTQDEVTIVKNSIAKGATDEELHFLLTVARRYKLDPFKQQIWFVKRWDKHADNGKGGEGAFVWVPQVGINGLLFIASRDHKGDFGSVSLPEFGPGNPPEWARVKVWKKGEAEPTEAEAWWSEYAPADMSKAPFWRKMPKRMIAKCAIALAIRQAYPDLGGLYIPEECERITEETTPEGRRIITQESGPTAKEAIAARVIAEKKALIEAHNRGEAKVQPEQGTPETKTSANTATNPPKPPQTPSTGATGQRTAGRASAASQPQTTGTGPQTPLMTTEYVDPKKSECKECGCSFGVHLKTCSLFRDPHTPKSVAPTQTADFLVELRPFQNGMLSIHGTPEALNRLVTAGLAKSATYADVSELYFIPAEKAELFGSWAFKNGVDVKMQRPLAPTGTMAAPKAVIPPLHPSLATAAKSFDAPANPTGPGILSIREPKSDKSPMWVKWGHKDCSCWDKKLWPYLRESINQVADLVCEEKEKGGKIYTNIVGIKRIGNRDYDESGPVRTKNDGKQTSLY